MLNLTKTDKLTNNEIRRVRLYSDLTQQELADQLGIQRQKLSFLERTDRDLGDVLSHNEYNKFVELINKLKRQLQKEMILK